MLNQPNKSRSRFFLLSALLLQHSLALAYIGGHATNPDQTPGAVALIVNSFPQEGEGPESIETCSAVVVGPRWLLTAAHCVAGIRVWGLHVVNTAELVIPPLGGGQPLPGLRVEVAQIFIHSKFKNPRARPGPRRLHIDIPDVALIQLKDPVDHPPARLAEQAPVRGDGLLVGGWGIPAETTEPEVSIFLGAPSNGPEEDLARLPLHLRYGRRLVAKGSPAMFTLQPQAAPMRVTFSTAWDEKYSRLGIGKQKILNIRQEIERSHHFEHISLGDSGGPAWRKLADGTLEVVGIVSLESEPSPGSQAPTEHLVRVDAKSVGGRWIRTTLKSH